MPGRPGDIPGFPGRPGHPGHPGRPGTLPGQPDVTPPVGTTEAIGDIQPPVTGEPEPGEPGETPGRAHAEIREFVQTLRGLIKDPSVLEKIRGLRLHHIQVDPILTPEQHAELLDQLLSGQAKVLSARVEERQ